jgi:hypothetical protein
MSFEGFPKNQENNIEKNVEKERSLANSRLQSIESQIRLADDDQDMRSNFDSCIKGATIPAIGALVIGLIAENAAPGTGGKEYGELLTAMFTGMSGIAITAGVAGALFHKIKRFIQGQETYSEDERTDLNIQKVNILYPNNS